MAICSGCGKTVADGKKFCTSCGKPVKAVKTRAKKEEPPVKAKKTAAAKPAAVSKSSPKPAPSTKTAPAGNPQQGSYYAVMSVGAYVLASILMCIPLIGLVICIVWAFVSCNNINKRNYARAILIFMLIGLVLSGLVILLSGWVRSTFFQFLPDFWFNIF